MPTKRTPPVPIFDNLPHLHQQADFSYLGAQYDAADIEQGLAFLRSYDGSVGTFTAYRREVERFIHWSTLVVKKTLKEIKREDIETYIVFCKKPPKSWIGYTKPSRFVVKNGQRQPNHGWRPFTATVSKAARKQGDTPDKQQFKLSPSSLSDIFAILSTFYNYLLQNEYATMNPVVMVRQKSKFIQKHQGQSKIRRLSDVQWQCVIKTAQTPTDTGHCCERTCFILSALYAMYLRISELVSSERWTPTMNDFTCDGDGNWWFTTLGKGNKIRKIAVSHAMLAALKRWRQSLGLPTLPSLADNSPLLPKIKGQGAMKSTNHVRRIIQQCFDQAIFQLRRDGLDDDADALSEATVHWLRHTGISDDVKTRPREHVRDDAGHSSGATTDRYIDVELRERHRTARKKKIISD